MTNVSAIVLAGGESRRFGSNKALVRWHGKPLIGHVIDTLKEQFEEIFIVTSFASEYLKFDIPVLIDKVSGKGPMGGIYTGLLEITNEYGLVVACDTPLLSPKLIALLSKEIKDDSWAIVPKVGGMWEPLLAVYSKRCIPLMEKFLSEGRVKMGDFLGSIPHHEIPEEVLKTADPDLKSFINLNTWEDLLNQR